MEYSLVERSIEREHIPAAQELGIGVCPWGPLAGGFLSGKYKREGEGAGARGDGRLDKEKENPFIQRFTERNWRILDVLFEVAKQLEKPPAQVALNWVATQPGITSTLAGATTPAQLDDAIAAIGFVIPTELRRRLDEVSELESIHPYSFFGPQMLSRNSGGLSIKGWQPARVSGGPNDS